ncbi:uncharacterized protein K452DRAFT_302311 [Aplosporella prunicola CBS 121167]|uniref:H-type lectin domain-containing protein n=1 Tax=Aplosporella prunicola CBS 121167 TaxID=1176127 RepID=A0A6A6B2T3_9PEZI|nr:uncharacterized protein K452DRAFT_302311 [Aplosporella prunicola CBS 121167]KAF2137031.1 hypothetical protein K452DRAFT_302311 [Aplosporella prunicola CBS 121167]
MELHLAPYGASMAIGQGYNSYTQETRLRNAVVVAKEPPAQGNLSDHHVHRWLNHDPETTTDSYSIMTPPTEQPNMSDCYGNIDTNLQENESTAGLTYAPSQRGFANEGGDQDSELVTSYTSRFVHELREIAADLNITGAAAIRSGSIRHPLYPPFVDLDQFQAADANYFVHVKSTKPSTPPKGPFVFVNHIRVDDKNFVRVYGDCFISGFLEGTEYKMLVSVTSLSNDKRDAVRAAARLVIGKQTVKDEEDENTRAAWQILSEHATVSIRGNWSDNEHTYSPQGQFTQNDILLKTAMRPPAATGPPRRLYAILTKYETLDSFHFHKPTYKPIPYEIAMDYTYTLLDAYASYKNIYQKLSAEVREVQAGTKIYEQHGMETTESTALARIDDERMFAPSITGVELARQACRVQMSKIRKDVDAIAKNPMLAMDENVAVYQSPAVFSSRLPKAQSLHSTLRTEKIQPRRRVDIGETKSLRETSADAQSLMCGIWDTREVHDWTAPVPRTSSVVPFEPDPSQPIPAIMLGMKHIDTCYHEGNMRFHASAESVTFREFTISVDQWAGSRFYGGEVSWLGVPSKYSSFETGKIESRVIGARQVKFSRPFAKPPSVLVWINGLDIKETGGFQVRARATGVTTESFSVSVDCGGKSNLRWMCLSWLAFSEESGCVMGTYGFEGNNQQKEVKGSCSFPKGKFSKPPVVIDALCRFHVPSHINPRLACGTWDVTEEGFNWCTSSWGDSRVLAATLQWIAIPSE